MAVNLSPSVGSDVLATGHKKVGKVPALVNDPSGQQVVAIDVQYGLLRHGTKRLPLDVIKWVNPESVVLELSVDEFKAFSDQPSQGAAKAHATSSK